MDSGVFVDKLKDMEPAKATPEAKEAYLCMVLFLVKDEFPSYCYTPPCTLACTSLHYVNCSDVRLFFSAIVDSLLPIRGTT